MAEYSIVGKSVPRLDGPEKVMGKAKFATEEGIGLPGMLYGKVLHSPYAHARILSIDTTRAERLPGVVTVLTSKDVPPVRVGTYFLHDRYLFCRHTVRFIGDPVAAVAADTVDIAEEALDLIKIEYEELPAVFDPEEAMRPDCPAVIHPGLRNYDRPTYKYLGDDLPGPNVHTYFKIRKGNVDDGFSKADLIVENRFAAKRVVQGMLEPYNAVVSMGSDGILTVWACAHCMYNRIQYIVSKYLEMPRSKIRVRSSYVGGNFGSGERASRYAAVLAIKTGKPVKVVFTREEVFIDGFNRLPQIIYIKDGVKNDGTLVAREVRVIANSGAYTDYTPLVLRNGMFCFSMYRVPNFKLDAYCVFTNEPTSGAMRGLGNEQPINAMEQQMDIIAEKLGMDAVEIRHKNLIKEGEEDIRGEITHSIGVADCLDKVAQWIGWGKPSEEPVAGNWKTGKGLALGNKYSQIDTAAAAYVKVHMDGTVELRHGSDEVGQGCNTVLAQIVAEQFQVPMDKVRVTWGDTDLTAYDFGAGSSGTTFKTGNALVRACEDAKRQMFALAAPRLGTDPADLETRDGKIYVRYSPEREIPISELFIPSTPGAMGTLMLSTCLPYGAEIIGKGTWFGKPSAEDPATGQGRKLTAFYGYTAQAAEVAVDMETGMVKVLRFASAFDMGQPINPKLCEGQMEGGMVMGIGSALWEQLVMDKGRVLNPNFLDYQMPLMVNIPSGNNAVSFIAGVPHREGPYGAKGVGEAAMTAATPAIANAVYNAVGVRIGQTPFTPEDIYRALQAKMRGGKGNVLLP